MVMTCLAIGLISSYDKWGMYLIRIDNIESLSKLQLPQRFQSCLMSKEQIFRCFNLVDQILLPLPLPNLQRHLSANPNTEQFVQNQNKTDCRLICEILTRAKKLNYNPLLHKFQHPCNTFVPINCKFLELQITSKFGSKVRIFFVETRLKSFVECVTT